MPPFNQRSIAIAAAYWIAADISSTSGAVDSASVTFNRQIAPIIYQNCSVCHRPGEAAPFSLLSYADVIRKAKTIATAVSSRNMPPWKPGPASYPYRDERRLSDEQINLIQTWTSGGMPEGDPSEKLEPPVFASGWRLGDPDLVVEMPAAYHIPAEGPDIYRNMAVSLGLTEDKWVAAIDMRTTARSAVHHVLYFADGSGRVHERPQKGTEPGFSGMRPGGTAAIPLGGWAIGAQPHFLPAGLATRVPKGSDFVVQYHFHPTGKAEEEKSIIGFYFAKKPPTHSLIRVQLPPHYSLFAGLDIPAGETNFVIRDSWTLPVAMDGVGIGAHAHYLATQMKMTATLPGGEVRTLLTMDDWDFAWQDRYFFKDFVPLPAGTRLEAEIHWNNSITNPRNPSVPPVRITWGEESKDEMGSVSLIAITHDESDFRSVNQELNQRARTIARKAMWNNPDLAKKVAQLLSE